MACKYLVFQGIQFLTVKILGKTGIPLAFPKIFDEHTYHAYIESLLGLYPAEIVVDPFMEHHKLVHNGGFPKFEVLYFSQNTVKSIKIQ